MSAAREEVLRRVRSALADRPTPPPVPRDYRRDRQPPVAELLDLLADRLSDYRARVRRCGPDELEAVLAAALSERGARRIVVPPGLAWSLPGEVTVDDGRLGAVELDGTDGVVTGCAVAVAETGTIVLDGGPGQGRRALTLVPDYHLCVVPADRVVAGVPEALARLEPTRAMTWISGPSATSDIELQRVEGVHGPRTLEVVVVSPA